jgi:hypothetical protein
MNNGDSGPKEAQVNEYDIRVRAYEIYLARVARGESGDEVTDWPLRSHRLLKPTPTR